PIDPALERLFTQLPANPLPLEDVEGRRRGNDATVALLGQARHPGSSVEDRKIPVDGGEITLRIVRPAGFEPPGPCYCYIHGGGWFMGTLDTAETECVIQPDDVPAVFVFVDYRLAPEHKFPIPHDDCVAAYRYLVEHHEELGIDAHRIAIGGGSAGANLSAAVSIAAREAGLPIPCLQLLEVPAVDLTLSSPSVTECGTGFGLTEEETRQCVRHYLNEGSDPRDPRVSPIFAADLGGLPPALIVVAELDPVRDDGERYAAALRAAGTEAACVRVLGHIHGSWVIPGTPAWGVVREMRISALRSAFAGTFAPAFARS
ncbi:MAG: alpha/beta hydrolase, partial [Acidimicrobiales bacterium]